MTHEELREAREGLNLSRKELAERLTRLAGREVSWRNVEQWEQGRYKLPLFLRLAMEKVSAER